MTGEARRVAEEEILRRLCSSRAYWEADTVLLYISRDGEVGTGELIRRCRADGKVTAAPRIEDGEMRFFVFTPEEELLPGAYSIPEPAGDASPDLERALVIVPGVAFDRERNRIGHGAGYYDRFLSRHRGLPSLALAFDAQVFDTLPSSPHDLRPDGLITESAVF